MNARPDEQQVEQMLQQEISAIRLSTAQRTRVAARLGIEHDATIATAFVEPTTDSPPHPPAIPEEVPMLTTTQKHSPRRRTLEWLGGIAAIVVVAVILVAIFRQPSDTGTSGVGTDITSTSTTAAAATATATDTATATPEPTAAAPSMPTPDDSGVYRGLTLGQAQQLVPFTLRMPDPIPEGLQGPDIMVIESPIGRPIYQMSSFFTLDAAQQPSATLQYTQMNASFTQPSDDEAELLQIGGKDVWKAILPRTDAPSVATYTWSADGVAYQVVAQLEGPLSEEILEAFIAAIPAGDGDSGPDASPTIDAMVKTTPSVAAGLPTSDVTGVYHGLTLAQAQLLTPFTLRLPTKTPESFIEPVFTVAEPSLPDRPFHQVLVFYELAGSDEALGMYLSMFDGPLPQTEDEDQDDRRLVQIGEKSVQSWLRTPPNAPLAVTYVWEANGVAYMVASPLEGGITEEILEAFIASIPVE